MIRKTLPILLAATLFASSLSFAADENKVMLNFVNADIESTVKAVGLISGKNFVLDPRVKGTINIVSSTPVAKDLVYPILLSSLRLQGFSAVESTGVIKIVPEADAKQHFSVTADKNLSVTGDKIVTQVFPLKYESAAQLVPILRPLITPNNMIAAYNNANTLVITDYAENIKRINRIVASIDQPSSAEFFAIPLKHSSALDVASTLARLMPELGTSGIPGQPMVPGMGAEGVKRSSVIADPRSNSLLIRSETSATAQNVRRLVEMLDQPAQSGSNINVVYLKNANATKLAQTLRSIITGDTSSSASSSSSSGLSQNSAPMQGGMPSSPLSPVATNSSASNSASGAQGGMIQADVATNSLIITAPDYVYRNIRAVIDKLDVRRAQVYLEALIAEVNAGDTSEFGFQWLTADGLKDGAPSYRGFGGTNFGEGGKNILNVLQNPLGAASGLSVGVARGKISLGGKDYLNLGMLARALEDNKAGNVLSTPNLLTLDNEDAKILVGQNVPFKTTSQPQSGNTTNPFTTFERKDIGITLSVTPQISEGGGITMKIFQEVSSIDDSAIKSEDLITKKRTIESKVLVDDGQIIVLGGLIENKVNSGVSKVPLLGDIPILGNLFKYESRTSTKTNLMVFLRPVVLKDGAAATALSGDRYEYIREQQRDFKLPDSFVLHNPPTVVAPELTPIQKTKPDSKTEAASQPAVDQPASEKK
ncbi:general secretion pathway protein D [Chitinivorax tropicus]|uniref:General secretion pathway protein D n=1 Tax=Chitinivorax tropicus TaxID=714531 RepID=A0A840MR12_9PROT|nr:type II secretion system secretin GspD [Chitinivorax tropicus]MBB5019537.1 general secretion pathway protein D [Chitinivorax tropicus]